MEDCEASVAGRPLDPRRVTPKTPTDDVPKSPAQKKYKTADDALEKPAVKPTAPKGPPPAHLKSKGLSKEKVSCKQASPPKKGLPPKKSVEQKKKPPAKPSGSHTAALPKWQKPPPKEQPQPSVPKPPPAGHPVPRPPPPVLAKRVSAVPPRAHAVFAKWNVPTPPPAKRHTAAPSAAMDTHALPWKAKRQHRGGKDNPVSLWWRAYNKAKAESPEAEALFLRCFDQPR